MLPDTSFVPAGLALALLLAGCGGGADETPAEPGAPGIAAPAQGGPARSGRAVPALATTEEPYASAELGALRGTILFEGSPPERFVLKGTDLPECKHHPEVDQRSNVLVVNDGKLAGAFVTLSGGYDEARIPPVPEAPVTLAQQGCMYVPRVVALRAGQALLVSNGDPTTHNVHLKARRNRELNPSMGKDQKPLEFRFDKVEQPIQVGCDIHPWMGAAVFVERHPWFALSDAQGRVEIRDVPPGEYELAAVHELARELPSQSGKVRVAAGKATVFTLTFRRKP